MNISVENATASDAPAIAALATKASKETFGHTAPEEDVADYLAGSYTAEAILAELPDPTRTTLLARDSQGCLVGMVQFLRGKLHPSVESGPPLRSPSCRSYISARARKGGGSVPS